LTIDNGQLTIVDAGRARADFLNRYGARFVRAFMVWCGVMGSDGGFAIF
jgi:hypothetical protein